MVNLRVGRAAVTQDVTNQQHMAPVPGLCLALRCSACCECSDEWSMSSHTVQHRPDRTPRYQLASCSPLCLQYSRSAQSHDSAVEVWVREAERKEGGEGQATCTVSNIHTLHPSFSHALSLIYLLLSCSFPQCLSECLVIAVNQYLIEYINIKLHHMNLLQLNYFN